MYNQTTKQQLANKRAILRVLSILTKKGTRVSLTTDEHHNEFIRFNGRTYAVTTNLPENAEHCNFFISGTQNRRFYNMECNGIILYHTGLDMFTVFDNKDQFCDIVEEKLHIIICDDDKKNNNDSVEDFFNMEYNVPVKKQNKTKRVYATIIDYLELADKFGYVSGM